MMSNPTISVLMPVYNGEKYLGEAIDSILNQTYTDFELLIINDGSTDGSEDIIFRYTDSRIKYLKNEDNKGLIYSRNLLISESIGKYIAFLDSDDFAMPHRLEKQLQFLKNNIDYALCGSWGIMIDANGHKIKKINLTTGYQNIKSSLLFRNSFIQSSIMIRKSVVDSFPYNEDYPVAEDYDLFVRISYSQKVENIKDRLVKYRWYEENISSTKKDLMINCVNKIHKNQLAKLGINATDMDLKILMHISSTQEGPVDSNYLKTLHVWLKWLLKETKGNNIYDRNSFVSAVCFRWIFACKERGSITDMVNLPALLSPRKLLLLGKMICERLY